MPWLSAWIVFSAASSVSPIPAKADAEAVLAALVPLGAGLPASSQGPASRTWLLMNSEATGARITRAITELQKAAGPEGGAVLYFAGFNAIASGRYFYLPWDWKPPLDNALRTAVAFDKALAPLASGKVLVFLDFMVVVSPGVPPWWRTSARPSITWPATSDGTSWPGPATPRELARGTWRARS